MSVAADLDQWASDLGTATGYTATRDPDLIHPPCLFVDLPESVTAPISALVLDLPVHIVGGGSGKQVGDTVLDMLATVLDATGQQNAEAATLTVGGITYQTYRLTVPVRVDPATVNP
jgi:hypothetical protein